MPQKAKPDERTILQALSELAGYEDIQTSEDLPTLSESKFMQKWGLPLMTGVEMETEDYDPGAVDAAFAALPFVGGPLKTGFKLAKEGVKRAGRAYRRAVRPRVFPQKDELLRMGEDVGVMEDELQALREATEGYQPGTYAQQVAESVEPLAYGDIFREGETLVQAGSRIEALGGFDVVEERLRRGGFSSSIPAWETAGQRAVRQGLSGASEVAEEVVPPQGYQPGTYAQQAEEAIPTQPVVKAVGVSTEENIRHIISQTEGTIRGGVGGGNLTYNQATSIYEDIGREGFDEFQQELLSMPQDARELAVDNFMANYKLSAGTVSGQEAAAVYKQTRFTSNMPDQVITTSRGSTRLEVKTYKTGKNTSEIRIDMRPLDYMQRIGKAGRAYARFSIEKITNAAGESFDRVHGIHFYGNANIHTRKVLKTLPDGTLVEELETIYPGQRYAGLIMRELMTKVPPNTLIDEGMLTYDSLYSLIRNTIKAQSKLIFNNPNLKRQYIQTSGPSEMSPITLLWNEMMETGIATDEATDRVIAKLDKMIKEYSKKGMVEGIPEFKSRPSRGPGYIQYNPISVHKLGVLIAGALGFKNKEAFIDFVSHDPESVEAQVFDNEFSL